MKIIIEIPNKFIVAGEKPTKGQVKKLNKWFSELSLLLSEGSFQKYTTSVTYEDALGGDKSAERTFQH